MQVNRIFSAEQIVVHPDLPLILKEWTKNVIRSKPKDVIAYSAEYFRQLAGNDKKYFISEQETAALRALFDNGQLDSNGKLLNRDLERFLRKDLGHLISSQEVEKIAAKLDSHVSGSIDFQDFLNWWCSIENRNK